MKWRYVVFLIENTKQLSKRWSLRLGESFINKVGNSTKRQKKIKKDQT